MVPVRSIEKIDEESLKLFQDWGVAVGRRVEFESEKDEVPWEWIIGATVAGDSQAVRWFS